MFSVQQKREIADAVQKILRDTGHPELPETEIQFELRVMNTYSSPSSTWTWALIRNNEAADRKEDNQHNERQNYWHR